MIYLMREQNSLVILNSKQFGSLSELEKQHAEKVKESIDRVKRNAADEVERERATCVQLRDALKSLQVNKICFRTFSPSARC